MNILITGVSGYVGAYLLRELEGENTNNIFGIYNSHKPGATNAEFIKCSLTNFDELARILNKVKPDVVYHLASVTPTRITNEPDGYIELFNNRVTEHIAKLSTANNSLLIYTSTDLVYAEGENLKEDESKLHPMTIYAKTKLMGEESVKQFAEKHIILRSSLQYGFTLSTYTSFFDVVYKTLKEGKVINAFTDQYRKIIYVEDSARILASLPGVYKQNDTINLCGDEYLSRYDMCLKMADAYGFDNRLIKKASCDEFTDYPMVKHLELNNDKMKKLGLKTASIKENLINAKKFAPAS
jgi:dTDP-4-dehydrorhamnose reductase